jgi:hypothetical protein
MGHICGCAMAQTVVRRPLTAYAQINLTLVYVGFVVEKVTMEQVLLWVLEVVPCQYYSINAPYSVIYCLVYNKVCYILSILYGAEIWTLRKFDQKCLESFETWF